ncbi:cytochrome P450 3A24-like [Oppia nitens]|uniref:cytochrome P450 3A24-like n=1 Tax=Oppia nitens TaxID=1686743 RepID=UPI0023DB685D|nr:cytochrome P450 3A24-like [Oppia nitens]
MEEIKDTAWKRCRKVMSPWFTNAYFKNMAPSVDSSLVTMFGLLDKVVQTGQSANMIDMYANFMIDLIAGQVYGVSLDSTAQPDHPFVTNLYGIIDSKWYRVLAIRLLPKFLLNLFDIRTPFSESAHQYFFQLCRHRIEEVRRNGGRDSQQRTDFIGLFARMLVNTEDDGNDQNRQLREQQWEQSGMPKYLYENEMLANAWFFTLGGFEGIQILLAFATYELALDPDLQNRVYLELQKAVDTDSQRVDTKLLADLPLLNGVVCETLRLHALVASEGRVAEEDYVLGGGGGDTGICIEKGTKVMFPFYAIHKSPDNYPEPWLFRPDRWLPENRDQLIPNTFMPFGVGPRHCIAERFALLEAKYVLTQLLRRYRVCRSPDTLVGRSTEIYLGRNMFLKWEKRN